MKKFLRNTLVFIGIFWLLNLVPQLFLSPHHGNKWYSAKYTYFVEHHERFNAVIWGSSRVDRHVNPSILDAALKDYHITTFNLGSPGTYNPEEYYLYDNFLKSVEKHPIKYAFLELQPLRGFGGSNLYASKNLYWLNLKYLRFSIKSLCASNLRSQKKMEFIENCCSRYIAKFLYGWKSLVSNSRSKIDRMWIGKNEDGFCPLDVEMVLAGDNDRLKERLTAFLEDTTVLDERASLANKSFSGQHGQFVEEDHLKKLMELIEKSKQKGIHLVFIIPPRLGRYEKLLALKAGLPGRHIIEMANPKAFPELYQVDYSFDAGHLNSKGADIFTEYLADELIKNVFNDGGS